MFCSPPELTGKVAAEHHLGIGMAAFGGGSEPALGGDAVPRHIVTAAEHGADGEHRADMALPGGFLEQRQGGRMVFGPAASGKQHVRQHDLGFDHADLSRLGDPEPAFLRVGVHASTFDEHAAVPVLRIDDAICRPAEPFGGLAVVTLNADAFGQANAEVEGGDEVAGFSRLLEPLAGADLILLVAVPAQQQVSEIDVGAGRPPAQRC